MLFGQSVYLYLVAVAKGVFHPGDKRHYRHRRAHTKIGYHLSVIPLTEGYYAVENREQNNKHLPEGMPLSAENKGSKTYYGGDNGEYLIRLKGKVGYYNA